MKAAVITFNFAVAARTRDEALELMDNTALDIMNKLGGAPWVAVDDDVKKVHMPGAALSDDQGYMYQGVRTCNFMGPVLMLGNQTYHDGNKPQFSVDDAHES